MPSYVIGSSGIIKNVTLTGETLDNLSIKVELDASNNNKIPTPPIYRAELIGTWKNTDGIIIDNAVLAKTDILTVSQGKASASFSDLPEYIGDATNLKVRIWYAASGLGPVYAYGRDQDRADKDVNGRKMNVSELVSVEKMKRTAEGKNGIIQTAVSWVTMHFVNTAGVPLLCLTGWISRNWWMQTVTN